MATQSKLRLSPTRISTFLTCRMMYKYDYVDKIGKFYHKSRAGNSFGATLHQALHDFHLAGGVASEDADKLTARANEAWRSFGFADEADEERYRALAVELLQNYHAGQSQRIDQTRVFLAEKMIKLDMGNFILTGRIDRIDEHLSDGTLEIIDYKSGRTDVTVEDVENALAMSIYQLILKRNHPERRVCASIYALRGGQIATAELSKERLDAFQSELSEIGDRIINTDWDSVRPVYLDHVCPDCDFLKLCEKFWNRELALTRLDERQ